MTTLIAATSDWHHHGWSWIWPLMWLLILVVIAVLWRGRRGRWTAACGSNRDHDPRAILAERYARGEISNEEYRERLGNLQA